jgi:hypothetical protein
VKRITILLAAGLVLLAAASQFITTAGAQPAAVTEDNLSQMIASAKTPADHQAIAAYYEQQAADAKKKAALHRNEADTYRKLKISKPVGMAEMCDEIAAMWDKIAHHDLKLAKAHQQMAKSAGS